MDDDPMTPLMRKKPPRHHTTAQQYALVFGFFILAFASLAWLMVKRMRELEEERTVHRRRSG